MELNATIPRSWVFDAGITLTVVGLLVVVFFLLEPSIFNKTISDVSFMLLGISVQLLGLALVIVGRK